MTNIRFMKFFVAAFLLGRLTSAAAADLESVTYSPDITVLLGSRTVVDHEVDNVIAGGLEGDVEETRPIGCNLIGGNLVCPEGSAAP